jgi:hypothetical protein
VRAQNINSGLFQEASIRLGNQMGGYFEYTAPSSVFSNAVNQWIYYEIPLSGNGTWQRKNIGSVSMDLISYVEIHADTWGGGFTLWLDGLKIISTSSVKEELSAKLLQFSLSDNFPNPFNPSTTFYYTIPEHSYVTMQIYDILGRVTATLVNRAIESGSYSQTWTTSVGSGVYFVRLTATSSKKTFSSLKKILLSK